MPRHRDPADFELTTAEQIVGCCAALSAVLSVAVLLLILGDYILAAIRLNGPANWGW